MHQETIEQLHSAAGQFQQGNYTAAAVIFQELVGKHPREASMHNNLGTALLALDRAAEAEECFGESLRLAPNYPEAHLNLGVCLAGQGRYSEAATHHRRATELNPQSLSAWINLGSALRQAGDIWQAAETFQTALDLAPDNQEALLHLVGTLSENCSPLEAVSRLDQIAASYAKDVETLAHIAATQKRLGGLGSAARTYRRALELDPQAVVACNNLGNILLEQGQPREALGFFQRAVQCEPLQTHLRFNLGNAFFDLGELAKARQCFQQVLDAEANYAKARGNLAATLKRQGDVSALRDLVATERVEPGLEDLHGLRLATILPAVYRHQLELDDCQAALKTALERCRRCAFSITPQRLPLLLTEAPHNLQFWAGNVKPLKQEYGRAMDAWISRPLAESASQPEATSLRHEKSTADRPLRVGIIVTVNHGAIFLQSLKGILRRISPSRIQAIVFCDPLEYRQIFDSLHGWSSQVAVQDLPNDLPSAIAELQRAHLDVAFHWEVGSDGPNYFLPFYRTAAVQCTSWGTQTTSGIPNMSYYISSRLVESDLAAEHYTEHLLLADTLLTYQTPASLPEHVSRSDFGFSAADHLYLCGQNLGKIHPDFDDWIARILRKDPAGRVILIKDRYEFASQILQQRFSQTLPDVADRVTFVPRLPRPDYLHLTACADVVLDAPHFSGVNTTYDAFALGKAVVTRPTEYHRGRYTLACYKKMGIGDLIATSVEDYVEKAHRIATDPVARSAMAELIKSRNAVLFRDAQAISEFERLLLEVGGRADA